MTDLMDWNENWCKLRCPTGSENGTCSCASPADCLDPPHRTPAGERMIRVLEHFARHLESGGTVDDYTPENNNAD